ncbi:hypothetical protein ASE63_22230 [Bosea sp. Root381]|uniref:hypothetical protein n=1 Tax=Bosea sp. Root381 TaxID=1736524 RepID=UPI000701F877|nr:hypothetical protein [Bosea sp. Root381]KRE07420.1 hypothetical protein ASE63_22230 [Bosea sp. Root381]
MRREFSRKLRAEIVLRATNRDGFVCCEECGLVLGKKPYEVDHTTPEALVMDKTKPLTADDGKLLGKDCCHTPKTVDDIRRIRKADRQRDRHTGAIVKTARPLPGSKASGWRHRMNGTWERR